MGDGGEMCTVKLDYAEAVILHEVLAFSEWAEDLDVVLVRTPGQKEILSRLQMALQPLIRELGTDSYEETVSEAEGQVLPPGP
jgi:hypothetical protein